MMRYKLIIADYGETLVHTGEKISVKNIEAIKKFQKFGGLFSIATGREWPSIRRKIQTSDLNFLDEMLISSCYGAIILSSTTEEIIFDAPLKIDIIKDLIYFFTNSNIKYSLVSKDKTFIFSGFDVLSYKWKKNEDLLLFNDLNKILEYVENHDEKLYKIDIYSADKVNLIIENINFKYSSMLKYYVNNQGFMEIVSSHAGKNTAYIKIKEYYELNDDDIIVVGDALNDLELFRNAKNKVAVSNAINKVLNKSTHIIDNSNYNGISKLIGLIMDGEKL